MQIYLAATPDKLREAAQFTDRLAHVAYRVGPDGRLTRQNLLARTHGGLMVLGDRGCGPVRDAAALCRDVWRECGNRGFGGVVADFEQSPAPDRAAFLEALGRVLSRNNRRLFVPENYGAAVPQAHVLICTALSGGSFCQRLQEAAVRFGKNRVALDVQRLAMDFTLPSPTGRGRPLPPEELRELMDRLTPSTFYSAELCAKYFTCTQNGESRFFLYDDADTIRQKIRTGHSMGFPAAFLMYPEVHDLLPQLFPRSGGTR